MKLIDGLSPFAQLLWLLSVAAIKIHKSVKKIKIFLSGRRGSFKVEGRKGESWSRSRIMVKIEVRWYRSTQSRLIF